MSGPTSRVVARASDTLASVLERLGESAALEHGRVFVDGRRARVEDAQSALANGRVVEVYAARSGGAELRVLRVEDGLAFVDKPPGIATEPEKRGATPSAVP